MSRWLGAGCVAIAATVAAPSALAQPPSPRVPLLGSVRDIYTRDGMLAGATVIVTENRTGEKATLITGPDGTFLVAALNPGTYTIAVSMPGYEGLVTRNFCVEVGKPARFDAAIGPERDGARLPIDAQPDAPVALAPLPVPSAETMSLPEIQEAMAFGRRTTKLEGYRLGPSRDRPTGSLFTPFLRVATSAQVAAATNRQFTESEIPAAFVQRVAWIVGFPIEHHVRSPDSGSGRFLASVTAIVIRPGGAKTSERDVRPAWKMYLTTTCDVDMFEGVLGRQFKRFDTVAAFPLDAIAEGNTIELSYAPFALPPDSFRGIRVEPEVRRVKIGGDDVRKWK